MFIRNARHATRPAGARDAGATPRRRSVLPAGLAVSTLIAIAALDAQTPASATQIQCPVAGRTTFIGGEFNAGTCEIQGTVVTPLSGGAARTFTNRAGAALTNSGSVGERFLFSFNRAHWINAGGASFDNNGFWGGISPNIIDNLGSVTNGTGGELVEAEVHNAGTLDNHGRWTQFNFTQRNTNGGTLTNHAGAHIEVLTLDNQAGARIDNRGRIELGVSPTGATGSDVGSRNDGEFVNSGEFLSRLPTTVAETAGNVYRNAGTFTNEASGTATFVGALDNTGTIFNSGILRSEIGAGEFTIRDGGLLHNHAGGSVDIDAPVTVLNGGSGVTGIGNEGRLSFANGGLLLGTGGPSNGQAVVNNHVTGELYIGSAHLSLIRDNGSLSNSGRATVDGQLAVTGSVVNTLGGTFEVADGGFIFGTGTDAAAFDNAGSVRIGGAGVNLEALGRYRQLAGHTRVDSQLRAGDVEIAAGTLAGAGEVEALGGRVHIGSDATVIAGRGPDNLTLAGGVDFDGTLTIDVLASDTFDVLDIVGDVSFGADSRIDFLFGDMFAPTADLALSFLTATGLISGLPNLSFGFSGLAADYTADVRFADSGRALNLTFTPSSLGTGGPLFTTTPSASVPEPSTLLLVGLALLGVGRMARDAGAVASMPQPLTSA